MRQIPILTIEMLIAFSPPFWFDSDAYHSPRAITPKKLECWPSTIYRYTQINLILGILTISTKFRLVVKELINDESTWSVSRSGEQRAVDSAYGQSSDVTYFDIAGDGSETLMFTFNKQYRHYKKPDLKVKHNENYIEWQYWDCLNSW